MLLTLEGQRYRVDVKYADAPTMTKSMRTAIAGLGLQKLLVVYPGTQRYALGRKVEAMPLQDALARVRQLGGRRLRG